MVDNTQEGMVQHMENQYHEAEQQRIRLEWELLHAALNSGPQVLAIAAPAAEAEDTAAKTGAMVKTMLQGLGETLSQQVNERMDELSHTIHGRLGSQSQVIADTQHSLRKVQHEWEQWDAEPDGPPNATS